MNTTQLLEKDFGRYSKAKPSKIKIIRLAMAKSGFRAVLLYRLGHVLRKKRLFFLAGLFQRIMHHTCHCYISVSAKIGPGFFIAHVGSIVIGGKTVIGAYCDVRQNVTLGGNYSKRDEDGNSQPILGDRVSVAAGACILGPVRVGANSIIGANSVLTRNIPEGVIAAGNPARVIKEVWGGASGRKL